MSIGTIFLFQWTPVSWYWNPQKAGTEGGIGKTFPILQKLPQLYTAATDQNDSAEPNERTRLMGTDQAARACYLEPVWLDSHLPFSATLL